MRLVYLLTKESKLLAFEGPEKPKLESKFEPHNKGKILSWETDMSTARESALPVVNASCMCKYESDALLFYIDKERIKIGPGETVALPGWDMEKVHLNAFFNEEKNEHVLDYAYRLVRSEPEKKEHDDTCGACWGSGWETQFVTPCRECGGKGTITLPEKPKECKNSDDCSIDKGTCDWPTCVGQEKPENSAHGECPNIATCLCITYEDCYFKKPDQGGDNIIVNPVAIEEHCQGINCHFEYSCTNGCMYPTKPVVESSESQEETDEMWMDVCVECYAVEIIGVNKVIKKLQEKFTITRK